MSIKISILLVFMMSLFACESEYAPKPRAYFRIELPQKKYKILDSEQFYSFEIPTYSIIEKNKNIDKNKYWVNILFPKFRASIFLSYINIENRKMLGEIIEDIHKLTYMHTSKADAILQEPIIDDKRRVYGSIYDIKGNVASSVQFYLTDSTKHFIRGALYFDCKPNADSLAPIINFIRKDILKITETLNWKK